MSECEHKEFEASVTVNRIEDKKCFAADVHIVCSECKRPFCFLGLPGGVLLGRPTVSLDQSEARLPIAPMEEYFWQLLSKTK
jgi:hypothetical protein